VIEVRVEGSAGVQPADFFLAISDVNMLAMEFS